MEYLSNDFMGLGRVVMQSLWLCCQVTSLIINLLVSIIKLMILHIQILIMFKFYDSNLSNMN